jgi:hypothetical protein
MFYHSMNTVYNVPYIPYLDYFLSLVQNVYAHNKSVNVLHY